MARGIRMKPTYVPHVVSPAAQSPWIYVVVWYQNYENPFHNSPVVVFVIYVEFIVSPVRRYRSTPRCRGDCYHSSQSDSRRKKKKQQQQSSQPVRRARSNRGSKRRRREDSTVRLYRLMGEEDISNDSKSSCGCEDGTVEAPAAAAPKENGRAADPRLQAISDAIRVVPHFPKPGIMFNDITALLLRPAAFKDAVDMFVERYRGMRIAAVAGIEARGFIFGPAIALAIGAKFIPLRKPKKLPGEVISETYILEYGTDCLEMHVGATEPGERVVVVDDLVATGGTLCAAIKLLERAGADVVECACLIGLPKYKKDSQLHSFARARWRNWIGIGWQEYLSPVLRSPDKGVVRYGRGDSRRETCLHVWRSLLSRAPSIPPGSKGRPLLRFCLPLQFYYCCPYRVRLASVYLKQSHINSAHHSLR
uniref:adenine phosphoribosyltransferase n=1 Tax=Oryza sativa subsp. japonica TaxID=39947 RepID=Q7X723_ORYSJ|nr:OSJNBa0014K14.11 [Oryza sativa Japonica Group]